MVESFNPIQGGPFGRFLRVGGGSGGPIQVWEGGRGLWFQILLITSYLTQIDTTQKDL